jgi:L,D-peptidoglycan transpeptidase YkuD (ErfK/YbiS/YcfS/YnhG family)
MSAAPGEAIVHADGRLAFQGRMFRCALGRGGVVAAERKHEGDGGTPSGKLKLLRVYYRADREPIPRTVLPRVPLAQDDLWCDDPGRAEYNRLVRRPFEGGHEVMWRDDALYDVVGELDWNTGPVVRGRGSAIFLHLARPDYGPTEGCVALARADLLALLAGGLTALRVLPPG